MTEQLNFVAFAVETADAEFAEFCKVLNKVTHLLASLPTSEAKLATWQKEASMACAVMKAVVPMMKRLEAFKTDVLEKLFDDDAVRYWQDKHPPIPF